MPHKASHRCAWPDCPELTTMRRCPAHEERWQRERNQQRPQYRGDWPKESRAQIDTYRSVHGDTCPGWRRAPHSIAPGQWTCDHDLGPLCRSCNSRKGATVDRRRRAGDRL